MPLTVDICRLNAQTLRDSTDKGETAWELLNPTLGVARHLPVLKINSRATAERSEVARISFPVLNYHPRPLVYFPTITHFQGTWLETTHGSRRERAAAPVPGRLRRTRKAGATLRPSVTPVGVCFLKLFLLLVVVL